MMRKISAAIVLFLVLASLSSFLTAPRAAAFEEDSHYYLKFLLALRVSCFSWDEAHLIASGDWGQDLNDTTTAHVMIADENTPKGQAEALLRRRWHAFGEPAEYTSFLDDIDARWKAEGDPLTKLIKLGQLLHFTEDRFSHEGFKIPLGHGVETTKGDDPDSLARTQAKSRAMVADSLTRLRDACSMVGDPPPSCPTVNRTPPNTVAQIMDEQPFKTMLNTIIEDSDKTWLKRHPVNPVTIVSKTAGTLVDEGMKGHIVAVNAATMRTYIEEHIGEAKLTAKCAPAPANPQLPAPLPIIYGPGGEFLGFDLLYRGVDWLVISDDSTSFALHITNAGTATSSSGEILVMSADPETGEVGGTTEVFLAPVYPGSESTLEISVPLDPSFASQFVTVQMFIGDDDAHNNGFGVILEGPVGGIVEIPRAPADPPAETSGSGTGLPIEAMAASGAGIVGLAGAGWHARRRWTENR